LKRRRNVQSRNRRLILVTVAVTALGVAGASLAAGDNEQAGPDDSAVAAPQPAGVLETKVATAVASSDEAETGEVLASDDGGSEVEVPITGTDLEKAAAVALGYTGGGRVTETEVGDEESYYEVEVTLDDGRQIDVQLDEKFLVVGSESDGSDES
jgi:hypothetical protein